jgi:hypothetical protein
MPPDNVLLYDAAVDRLVAQFGSENQSTIEKVVNEKVRQMLADSEYRAATPSLGATVAGQAQYAITDPNVESYRLLRVGTVMYQRVGTRTLWELQDTYSDTTLRGPGGVFAPMFGDDATRYIELYPVPDAGQTIEVLDYAWVPEEEDFQAGIAKMSARGKRRVGGGVTRARVGVGGRY